MALSRDLVVARREQIGNQEQRVTSDLSHLAITL